MNYEPTIKKVCEKTGDDPNGTGTVLECIKKIAGENNELAKRLSDIWLYGFLTEEATLKAVFGLKMNNSGLPENGLPMWKCHGRWMGYTLDSVLKYYEKEMQNM